MLGHKGVRKQSKAMMPLPSNNPRSRKKKGKKKKKKGKGQGQHQQTEEHTLITSPGGTSTNTQFSSSLAAIATAPLPSAPLLPPSLALRHASAMANNEVTFIMIKPDGVQRGLVSVSLSLSFYPSLLWGFAFRCFIMQYPLQVWMLSVSGWWVFPVGAGVVEMGSLGCLSGVGLCFTVGWFGSLVVLPWDTPFLRWLMGWDGGFGAFLLLLGVGG